MVQKRATGDYLALESGHGRAIVIGGSIAGLLAARVLSEHFDRVLLLERDEYPDTPDLRSGVPQAHHVHILLIRGKQILERLFPGLSAEMVRHGACTVNTGQELAILGYHGWRVQYHGGLTLLTFTRPLLDWCIRRRLADRPQIDIVDGCRVTGLVAERDCVTGVRCRFLGDSREEEETCRANLVVDASGRFSRTPEWLSALCYARPDETSVNSFLGYASRVYEPAPAFRSDWKALLLLGKPPNETRGGVLMPVEGGRWLVTLAGTCRDYPPTDDAGFLAFARTLRSQLLYDAIEDARPCSSIAGYRATENRLRHYESLTQWPDRFVVLGDAVCAFNPIYGQGMTAAALGAVTLDRCLREYGFHRGTSTGDTHRFQQELARVNATPWLMATGEDFRWPATEGERPGMLARVVYRYLDGVMALATESPEADRTFSRVAHLIDPPHVLLYPRIAVRVLGQLLNSTVGSEDR